MQGERRVDQRLALFDRGGGDRHVDDVGAEPLGGQFEAGARAGGFLEEEVHHRAAAQRAEFFFTGGYVDIALGEIEQSADLHGRHALDAEDMAVRKSRGCGRGH